MILRKKTRTDFASQKNSSFTVLGLTALAALLAAPSFADTVLFPELSATLLDTTTIKELRVVGVPLSHPEGTPGASDEATLALRPMDVFAQDARITIQTAKGEIEAPRPGHAYFGGTLEGRPASRVILTLLDRGGVRGVIQDGASWWRIGEVTNKALGVTETVVRRADPGEGEPFRCGNADLPADLDSLLADVRSGQQEAEVRPAAKATEGLPSYTAHIAFETDQEYLALFGGNTTDATDYVGDLVALGSMIYTDEVATSWVVQSLNLWTTTDPWTESSSFCRLLEFGKYWNDNNSGVERTVAHLLSGRSSNSGIAWIGILCRDAFDYSTTGLGCSFSGTSNYGGDYGLTSGIDGNLDINNPAPLWDSVGVLHEIGHNFNSPHTHCYETLNGSSDPIDPCYNFEGIGMDGTPGTADDNDAECWSGTEALPSGCPGTGSNCGTIMSYCHLTFAGGIGGNIDLVLGDSPYGILPSRVPTRMGAHVVARDLANPGCLDVVADDEIFTDGFESGNTSAWDNTVN